MRMQGIVLLGAFLKLTPYAKDSGMSDEEVYAGVEKALRKYFGKRGDRVVQDNLTCGQTRIQRNAGDSPDDHPGWQRPGHLSFTHNVKGYICNVHH